MKTRALMFVLVTAFAMAFVGCGGGGASTPEGAVEGMMDAAQAKDWGKAVSYMDLEGLLKFDKEMSLKMLEFETDEEKKEKKKKEIESKTVEDFKKEMIEEMKADKKKQDFEYKIIKKEDVKKDESAIVLVEITPKGEDADKVPMPLKKIDGVWKMSAPSEDMMEKMRKIMAEDEPEPEEG